ncbi:ureidoglycolate lyase [Methylobacterium organophilum]|uniref:ureidoglycolate lyase n=1 Tax=Methylobacterium organophilum TaxID=410 RepID=UPI001F141F58|nr:ureidoglycolate lyase [Methylobacterium organophilum]UMY17410.1 ureidoglycolate lyase [Methylobacterium organophilum]
MSTPETAPEAVAETRAVPIHALTPEAFAPFGTVVVPMEDGVPFGPQDAQLDFSAGTPRFYAMRLPARGLTIHRITRHKAVTQTLASVGGKTWYLGVAAPGEAEAPTLESIKVFRIPGDAAVALYKGTWHAGPLFEGEEQSFFNLELADTNVVDHDTCNLIKCYGCALMPTA